MRHLHTIIAITLKWNSYLSTFLRLWLKNSEDFPLQLLVKVKFFTHALDYSTYSTTVSGGREPVLFQIKLQTLIPLRSPIGSVQNIST